ncbi:MAG TPA: fluoride efflux transporter CrcB [Gammaproteobacteria bacterium]|jgi:CrcB protein|nr:fluoride efflux transporter CrcB [Gammaproteobacteria bacterium]
MWNYVAVALGGVVGCCARYGVSQAVHNFYGRGTFPLATLIINVSGCLLMGFLFQLTLDKANVSYSLRLAILTGVLGGFTTFSAFAMETLLLAEEGEMGSAALYILMSVSMGLLAAYIGVWCARSIV